MVLPEPARYNMSDQLKSAILKDIYVSSGSLERLFQCGRWLNVKVDVQERRLLRECLAGRRSAMQESPIFKRTAIILSHPDNLAVGWEAKVFCTVPISPMTPSSASDSPSEFDRGASGLLWLHCADACVGCDDLDNLSSHRCVLSFDKFWMMET